MNQQAPGMTVSPFKKDSFVGVVCVKEQSSTDMNARHALWVYKYFLAAWILTCILYISPWHLIEKGEAPNTRPLSAQIPDTETMFPFSIKRNFK